MLNFVIAVGGIILFVAGIVTIKDCIKKRTWKDAPVGGAFIFFGAVILLAAINLLFR